MSTLIQNKGIVNVFYHFGHQASSFSNYFLPETEYLHICKRGIWGFVETIKGDRKDDHWGLICKSALMNT